MANSRRQVEEITIDVPWGQVAGKWWGPRNVRPILAIHGWQDNAGTFDLLIPLLPDHVSYLAIDLPGHGLSSQIPQGQIYGTVYYLYVVKIIVEKFKWDKVSLLGHSLGGIICFLYASTHPEKCDMVISIDTLKPFVATFPFINAIFPQVILGNVIADQRNAENTEPPSYTREELIDKMNTTIFLAVTREAAPYLLERAVTPSKLYPNKFYFTRDSRVKTMHTLVLSHEVNVALAQNVIAPYCFVKALNNNYTESRKYFEETLLAIVQNNEQFEIHGVVGDHHVHLTDPQKVSGIFSTFIHKYRPIKLNNKL